MPKVAPVCSSSKGNAVFVGTAEKGVLIDCGCSYKALGQGLELMGIRREAVKCLLITHEHSDHIRGLKTLTKCMRIPVYASPKTLDYIIRNGLADPAADLRTTAELENAPVQEEIIAFRTPHDSVESVGYTIKGEDYKFSLCTDLGQVTETVRFNLRGSDFVFLESNYDRMLLRNNTVYPPYLKARIASDHGHLSNDDSATFLTELIRENARRIVLGHLSQENNTPQTALNNALQVLSNAGMERNRDFTIEVAPVTTNGRYVAF